MNANLLARHPEEGARLLALSFLDQARAARPRLADPSDSEALHDFRVALRRLRSCLRAYRSYLDESVPRKLARKLKKLAQATGPGRDTEVQIAWLRGRSAHLSSSHRAGQAWLVARLEGRMREAYEDTREEIERDFDKIEEALRRRLSVYRTEIHLGSEAPQSTLAEATAGILRKQVEELESHLARIEDAEDETEGHEARISAKRVRYLLEPFVDAVPGAGPVVKRFKALQDLLGDLHDAHVLETELTEALETAAAERARTLLDLSLADVPDDNLLRAERRRARESGLIALARLNRVRRDRLFEALEAEWLEDKANVFLREVEALGKAMGNVTSEDL
ncbi:MAG TPA: CHAD domain-containing protein [Thermoanaerobaculia bacterium]|nr:CHAD domain-containing protein [Thermoanaerobaculia bacterium]